MNESISLASDSIATWSRRLLFFSAAYVVACIPAIFVAESLYWPQWPFHTSQLLMCIVCAASATTFWFRTRGSAPTLTRRFAFVAMLLSSAWLAFICIIIVVGSLYLAYEDPMP